MWDPLLPLLLFAAVLSAVHSGLECDFEQPCSWGFDPPYDPPTTRGFRVVSGKEAGGKSGT